MDTATENKIELDDVQYVAVHLGPIFLQIGIPEEQIFSMGFKIARVIVAERDNILEKQ